MREARVDGRVPERDDEDTGRATDVAGVAGMAGASAKAAVGRAGGGRGGPKRRPRVNYDIANARHLRCTRKLLSVPLLTTVRRQNLRKLCHA